MKNSFTKGLTCISIYICTISGSYAAGNTCIHTNNSFNCVEYSKNYDADTINFNIPNLHHLFGNNSAIHLSGITVPSPNSKTSCVKDKGKKARDFVKSELKSAKLISLTNLSKKRGKIYGEVEYDGKHLSKILLKKQMASKTKKNDWCS